MKILGDATRLRSLQPTVTLIMTPYFTKKQDYKHLFSMLRIHISRTGPFKYLMCHSSCVFTRIAASKSNLSVIYVEDPKAEISDWREHLQRSRAMVGTENLIWSEELAPFEQILIQVLGFAYETMS